MNDMCEINKIKDSLRREIVKRILKAYDLMGHEAQDAFLYIINNADELWRFTARLAVEAPDKIEELMVLLAKEHKDDTNKQGKAS